ncbi:DUF3221 domain-containing protein [Sporosarcina luteola]|uniref:DUF3221 domain-containing protein n=1 Tax=Sporosarcina luteola TaxID=582850 RepID=UPI00204120E4|nr:DUF3221 domain-containing protein [Sporosarcina luteola]MCM3709436.1 YobA family protein [Sporosarcina luteola]
MKNKLIVLFASALLLGGCGTGPSSKNGAVDDSDSGWKSLKTVSGREIIAELKQTVEETPKRDERATIETPPEFEEPTKETVEDLNVKAIEGPAVFQAVEKVYGEGGIHHEGVIFFELQTKGAAQSGVWIGLKEPDERVQQLIDLLQPKVDAGEILAEPIYIFRSPHTEKELYELQDEVAEALKGLESERGSFGLYVDVITGNIEITHDFLKPEQQEKLREQFADHTINIEQDGRMVPEPGESTIIAPEQTYTDKPVTEGGFILEAGDGRIFVAGGTESVVFYKFPEADKLKAGQRVNVERSGPILESYPGQGTAKFVEVLPDYKPAGAKLSESQAVAKALEVAGERLSNGYVVIEEVSFDENEKKWVFKLLPDDGEGTLEVADQ